MRPATAPLVIATALAAACAPVVQTTSGADYLARWDAAAGAPIAAGASRTDASASAGFEAKIREAAAVEPILAFPARFGIARIEAGRLAPIPPAEAEAWARLAAELGPSVGRFEPVDPLVAEMTRAALDAETAYGGDVGAIVAAIRLGAARQHLDAVLVYAAGATAEKEATALAFADLTIIGGAFLPTREIEAEGRATAVLIDVRNGYPYGRTQTSVSLAELATSWGSDGRVADLARAAEAETVAALVPEVLEMFDMLIREMALKRL